VLIDRVNAMLPIGFEAVTGEATSRTQDQAAEFGLLTQLMAVFGSGLLAGGIIIANTPSILIAAHPQLALMRACGASRSRSSAAS
jgi:hypothetical protein